MPPLDLVALAAYHAIDGQSIERADAAADLMASRVIMAAASGAGIAVLVILASGTVLVAEAVVIARLAVQVCGGRG